MIRFTEEVSTLLRSATSAPSTDTGGCTDATSPMATAVAPVAIDDEEVEDKVVAVDDDDDDDDDEAVHDFLSISIALRDAPIAGAAPKTFSCTLLFSTPGVLFSLPGARVSPLCAQGNRNRKARFRNSSFTSSVTFKGDDSNGGSRGLSLPLPS